MNLVLANTKEFKGARIWQHDFPQPVSTTQIQHQVEHLLIKAGQRQNMLVVPLCTSHLLCKNIYRYIKYIYISLSKEETLRTLSV